MESCLNAHVKWMIEGNRMRMNKIFQSVFIGVFILSVNQSVAAGSIDEIIFMTEEYPPFNYTENGALKGLAVELLDRMLRNLNSKLTLKDVTVYPWARGYHLIQKYPNMCLFGMTSSPKREPLFKWVGPFAAERNVLIGLKDRKMKIHSLQDLGAYRIGAVRDDIGGQLLIEKGIAGKRLDLVPGAIQNIRKLMKRRIDVWVYGDIVAFWQIRKNGFNPDDFEIKYKLDDSSENFFAFNKETSDTIIRQFQDALDALKKKPESGQSEYEKILERYFK